MLQCTAVYPAEPQDLHLSVIDIFRSRFPGVVVGFSGHDKDIDLSLVAYALGAWIVEKHFTLDRGKAGSDHHFSLEPQHLADLVDGLGRAHRSLGDPCKQASETEKPALRKMGKKLVAARDLCVGHTLSENDIAIKSPGDGMRPYRIDDVVGRRLVVPLQQDADLFVGALN